MMQCRRVLKWTYAYGYYEKMEKQQRDQFEFWQTDLEQYCDTLHGMVEKPLDEYMDPNILDRSPFYKFKGQLVSFYMATQKYHESLVKGLCAE